MKDVTQGDPIADYVSYNQRLGGLSPTSPWQNWAAQLPIGGGHG